MNENKKIEYPNHVVVITSVEPFRFEFLFFTLKRLKLLSDIRIDEISNVFTIHDFRYHVGLPVRISQKVVPYIRGMSASTKRGNRV